MIQDDLQNVDFLALTEIERMEFNMKLLANYNLMIQQLMVGRNFEIAGVMSVMLGIQTMDAKRLASLVEYAKLLYTTMLQEQKINEMAIAANLEAQTPAPVPVPPPPAPPQLPDDKETTVTIDDDGTINVDGKSN